jgi:hypothetical protein
MIFFDWNVRAVATRFEHLLLQGYTAAAGRQFHGI